MTQKILEMTQKILKHSEGVTVQHTAEQKEGQIPESPTKHVVIGKTETTTGGEAVGVGARKKIIKGK